ncbi:YebC/PmpR family DNA-binding transcriptional regulator [Limnochorda pilosa]|uniref:Probable transcriptional regulatory protein LIP_2481 n=1 Tax=Limnochorda pilosa TaxID=1555112 RepID=A0A0K2SMI0_LIMPI|nr:transcriptional regulator [Limnochorda pilosa]
MSGHSKWANIKHKKTKEDARRGQVFTKLSRQITVAARNGGGDPEANFQLRLAIDKAKDANMPNESIDRAIRRGTGELGGEAYEQFTYEGYAPGGVAVLVDIMTDNRNRAAGDVRYLFSRHDGSLGEAGSVAWMFDVRGLVEVDRAGAPGLDEVMLLAADAGAEDVEEAEDRFVILTSPQELDAVRRALEDQGLRIRSAELTYRPRTTVELDEAGTRKVLKLIDALEENDDVQQVYTNLEIPDEILEKLEA